MQAAALAELLELPADERPRMLRQDIQLGLLPVRLPPYAFANASRTAAKR